MLIVARRSLSASRTRNFSSLKATPTYRNVVRNAAAQGNQSATVTVTVMVTATAVMVPRDKCSQRFVPSVVRVPKFRFSLAKTGQFTAAIVSEKSKLVDKYD